MPPVGGGDYIPSQSHPPVHHGAAHYGSAPPSIPLLGPAGEDARMSSATVSPPVPSTSSPPPPSEYSRSIQSQQQQSPPQHHLHQSALQQQHLHAGPPPLSIPPGPLHGGMDGMVESGGYVNGNATAASSLPWTVGSTDGSFATMTVMQQQQQRQQEADLGNVSLGDNASKNGAGGATIGEAGEANKRDTNGTSSTQDNSLAALATIQAGKSLYHDRLFHQSSSSVESVLTSSCDVMGFDIAEMWLRTGPKTHQLTNSHLRPTALEDSVRKDLVEVYYGEKSNERTHRLSPALCKRAKDANDVVWVTAHTQHGAEALRMSISNVRTAVAVPVCHEASNTNITIIYFSIRR
jgi:hypothetical protein